MDISPKTKRLTASQKVRMFLFLSCYSISDIFRTLDIKVLTTYQKIKEVESRARLGLSAMIECQKGREDEIR